MTRDFGATLDESNESAGTQKNLAGAEGGGGGGVGFPALFETGPLNVAVHPPFWH